LAGFAAELAAETGLTVPRAGLAADAVAVAHGTDTAPRRLGAPDVPAGASVGESLRLLTAHLADVILYWAPIAPVGDAPEPVHQMRVAVRRLRSALSVFRRAVPDDPTWLDDLAERLQSLATLLGGARDWDVFLAETGASVAEALPGDRRIAGMLAAAARKRLAAYQQVREFLAAPENGQDSWRRLALTLALLPTRRPWSLHNSPAQAACLARPASDYAAGALDRRLKQLLSAGPSLEGLPHEQLHDIRKQAKRVRYAIEFFASLFPEKAVRKYLARMQDLQEEFGTLNDTAVAAGLVATLGGGADRAFAAGAVQGFGAARMLRAERRVQRTWARFYRQTPFWD
jgi:CHAD domain-containing protein